jgi:hypothetical protein
MVVSLQFAGAFARHPAALAPLGYTLLRHALMARQRVVGFEAQSGLHFVNSHDRFPSVLSALSQSASSGCGGRLASLHEKLLARSVMHCGLANTTQRRIARL